MSDDVSGRARRQTAASGAAWLVGGRIASDALAFVLFVTVARTFGPEGIGVYAFSFAVASIVYEIATLGIDEYGVREYARRGPDGRRLLIGRLLGAQLVIVGAAALAVVLFALAGGLLRSYGVLLGFMVLYQIGCALAQTFFVAPFASGRVQLQAAGEVAARAGILLLALAMVRADAGLASVLAGFPIFGVLLAAGAAVAAHRQGSALRPNVSASALAETLRALWSFAAANLMLAVFSRIGVLLLFVLAGTVPAGLFASAYKFAEVGWVLLSLLPWAAYAELSRTHRAEPERFRLLAGGTLRATLAASAALAWGMLWVVPAVAPWLLGPRFEDAEPALRVLAVWVLLLGIDAYLTRIMLVADMQRARLRVTAIQAVTAVGVGAAAIPMLGPTGAAAALVAAQLAAVVLELAALRGEPMREDTNRALVELALCAAGACAAGGATMAVTDARAAAALTSLCVLGVAMRAAGLLPSRPRAWTPARGSST